MSQRLTIFFFLLLGIAVCVPEVSVKAGGGTETCAHGKENCYEAGYAGLTPLQREGRDTWYVWTGEIRTPRETSSAIRRCGEF
jgi:hypothetical protein